MITKKLIYIPIDVNEVKFYHETQFCLKDNQKDICDYLGDEKYYSHDEAKITTQEITHWLKPIEQYVFSEIELKELLEKTFDAGEIWEYSNWKVGILNKPDKQTFINSILDK